MDNLAYYLAGDLYQIHCLTRDWLITYGPLWVNTPYLIDVIFIISMVSLVWAFNLRQS